MRYAPGGHRPDSGAQRATDRSHHGFKGFDAAHSLDERLTMSIGFSWMVDIGHFSDGTLLVSEGFDGVETGGLPRRVVPEEDPDRRRKCKAAERRRERNRRRPTC